MKMESRVSSLYFDPFNTRTEAEPTHGIGEVLRLADKRQFVHFAAGGSNISRGKLQLAPAPKTNHHSCTAIASVAGTQQPTFTLGATAAVVGEYDEGYIEINVTPDVGRTYKISRMGAILSGGTALPVLYEPIVTAWTTATRVSLIHNAYAGVVEAAVATRRAAGVPLIDVSAGDFGWAQSRGVAGILADGAVAVGNAIVPSDAVAGAAEQQDVFVNATDATRLDAKTNVGRADIMALVDTEYRPVTLAIG